MAPPGFEQLQQIAKVAYDTASTAALVIPAAWSSVAVMYMAQSDPAQIWDAADAWREVADNLLASDKEISEQLSHFAHENWSGSDRDAFEKQLHDYQNQIRLSYAFALAVYGVMRLMALAIAAFILFMAACAAILAYSAALVLIALCTVEVPVVGQAELAAAEAEATATAGRVRAALKKAEGLLETAGNAGAAVLGALMTGDVLGQMITGNTQAFPDFAEALVASGDDVALGRLALMEQTLTGQLMRGHAVGGVGAGKLRLPMLRIPSRMRDVAPIAGGLKGGLETGLPGVDSGPLSDGTPLGTKGVTTISNNMGVDNSYGDDYVLRTNPIPVKKNDLPGKK